MEHSRKRASPFTLEGLRYYTRQEAELLNWFARFFPGFADWDRWASEILGTLLERPAGLEVHLKQTHCVEQQDPKVYAVEKNETVLGRAPENDVVLAAKSVSKQHARILIRDGAYYLEDLGSQVGTYVGQRKLGPGKLQQLNQGDHFVIFPYSFAFEMRRTWVPETNVEIYCAGAERMRWKMFAGTAPSAVVGFRLSIHPVGAVAYIQIGRGLLEEVLSRLLREQAGPLTASDSGAFEFLFLALLERANRQMRFPFQLELAAGEASASPETLGLAALASIRLTDLKGVLRLFIPDALTSALRGAAPSLAPPACPAGIPCRFPVTAGSVELSSEEMARLEVSDILLFTAASEMLFPGDPDRGWKASRVGDNPWRVSIDKYFERGVFMEEKPAAESAENRAGAPNVSRLSVRLHVVLGMAELTLAEVGNLVSGTIVELDKGKSDPVRLAVNGKFVGEGELVEVEGKIGVKITGWSSG